MTDRITSTARRVFKHDELRPGQRRAVQALLDGHDVLLVQPTGAGKSLTYQLAAVLLDGPTLVVSPLLALQADQTEHLAEYGRTTRARRLSSAETPAQRADALEQVRQGHVEFLFLAPEQLANPDVHEAIAAMRPSLVAVDEAHCVSSWGHDFRPDYRRLGELLDGLGARTIAMTATAAPPVRADIVARLGLQRPVVLVGGAARENLDLAVRRCLDERDQQEKVLTAAVAAAGSGIVYVGTRKAAEQYAQALVERGVAATAYHAGLGKKVRERAQRAFMTDEASVIVATSAFGMGIDKPDVHWGLHAHVPESPDEYYQQVGRAGRDGTPATGTLFFRPEDLALARFHTVAVPKPADVTRVLGVLASRPDAPVDEQAELAGLSPRKLARIANLVRETAADAEIVDVADVRARAEEYQALQKSRVEMMRGYAETRGCRREFLLGYLGEPDSGRCGRCDNCRDGYAEAQAEQRETSGPPPFRAEQPVRHPTFGDGLVMSLDGDAVTVLFQEVGYRTLSVPTVLENNLLTSPD